MTESNAIAYYVADETLRGKNVIDQSLVRQYIEFAENEILPSACTWVFPTLGYKSYNKQDTERAQNHIKKCMVLLNKFLESRTFLVGERITLADIALCCNMMMLYAQVSFISKLLQFFSVYKVFCHTRLQFGIFPYFRENLF